MSKYEIFEDDKGEWRWHLKAGNGEIVAQSEGYTTKAHAERGAGLIEKLANIAQAQNPEGDPSDPPDQAA